MCQSLQLHVLYIRQCKGSLLCEHALIKMDSGYPGSGLGESVIIRDVGSDGRVFALNVKVF